MAERQLTEQQRYAAERYREQLIQAATAARKNLSDAGFGDEAQFECLFCGCEGFRFGPPLARDCATPGCNHQIFDHNLPT